jgi:hypothetical protein
MKTAKLNNKELAVLRQCAEAPATLKEIAARFRRAEDKTQANSWARNSVRRPVRMGLLKKVARGTYGITAKGKTFIAAMANDADKPKAKAKAKAPRATKKAAVPKVTETQAAEASPEIEVTDADAEPATETTEPEMAAA